MSWSGPAGAEEQVKGYPGAVFKGFATRSEAEQFMRGGSPQPVEQGKIDPIFVPVDILPETSPSMDHHAALAAGKIVVFTDGASTGNPGPGGYGAVVLYGDVRKELSGGFRRTTNNRMEMMACIVALNEIKHSAPVVLYSDSQYVVNAVEKGWARRWRSHNWMRSPDRQGNIQRAENVDLWIQLLDLLDRIPVKFHWVKGHASHPENERCDRLAVWAARKKDLPDDVGFSSY